MSKKNYFAGIDVGTSYVKTVIINDKNEIVGFQTERTGPDLQKSINISYEKAVTNTVNIKSSIKYVTATGFGRNNVSFANKVKTEISSHARGAYHYFSKEITIIDIGGQDTKIIKIDRSFTTTLCLLLFHETCWQS